MANVRKSVLVPYSREQMFTLVEAVEDYPTFLPWCGGVEVVERRGARTVVRIDIDFHGVRAHFTTANHNEAPERITMALRDGPFRKLDGGWKFRALAKGACKVEFALKYEFATKPLEALIGPVFEHVADTFIDAFVRRAESMHPTTP
ncbi:MAG: type II toxin-antitoxin system RatA family toxin [Betaproteobacteria bacterium]